MAAPDGRASFGSWAALASVVLGCDETSPGAEPATPLAPTAASGLLGSWVAATASAPFGRPVTASVVLSSAAACAPSPSGSEPSLPGRLNRREKRPIAA